MNQQQKPGDSKAQFNNALNWLTMIVQSTAMPIIVLLRTRIGERFLDLRAGIAILCILTFSLFFPDRDPGPLMLFLGVYVVACTGVRLAALRRRARGEMIHTRYSGWPRLARLFRGWDEIRIKGSVEPVFALGVGMALFDWSQPLGGYLIFAALALFISVNQSEGLERARRSMISTLS